LDIGAPVFNYLPEFKDLQVRVEQSDSVTGKKETVMQPQLRPMTVRTCFATPPDSSIAPDWEMALSGRLSGRKRSRPQHDTG